jgi:hypothetical protein
MRLCSQRLLLTVLVIIVAMFCFCCHRWCCRVVIVTLSLALVLVSHCPGAAAGAGGPTTPLGHHMHSRSSFSEEMDEGASTPIAAAAELPAEVASVEQRVLQSNPILEVRRLVIPSHCWCLGVCPYAVSVPVSTRGRTSHSDTVPLTFPTHSHTRWLLPWSQSAHSHVRATRRTFTVYSLPQ